MLGARNAIRCGLRSVGTGDPYCIRLARPHAASAGIASASRSRRVAPPDTRLELIERRLCTDDLHRSLEIRRPSDRGWLANPSRRSTRHRGLRVARVTEVPGVAVE